MIRINSLYISGIGPIQDLSLAFNPHMNIICGANGIGKTTILNCIAQTFIYSSPTLRKNSNVKKGLWQTKFSVDGEEKEKTTEIDKSRPNAQIGSNNIFYQRASEVIYYRTNRSMAYQEVASVTKDPTPSVYDIAGETSKGSSYLDIKKWFVNRFLWSPHQNGLKPEQHQNLNLAIQCFHFANRGFQFSRVDPETNDIIIATPLGEIVLEQLSAGYISLIILLLGIIKDIEYRFKEPSVVVSQYRGVLVIDEIDVHLHPELQAMAYVKLKELLPNAQIFTSTHSPHIIQVAEAQEIIPLVMDEKYNVHVNPLVNREYGCQGWTVEEVLTDVMGMSETRTSKYNNLINEFNRALDEGNQENSNNAFSELDKMLHPGNVLRQVLEIQKI